MPRILYLFLSLIPSALQADDLGVVFNLISCEGKNDRGFYEYKIGIAFQNITDKDLKLITKMESISTNPGEIPEIYLSHYENRVNDVLFIPTDAEIGLVTLQPNEGAQIYKNQVYRKPLPSKVYIGYEGQSVYGGRYGNWVGKVKSGEPTEIHNYSACTS